MARRDGQGRPKSLRCAKCKSAHNSRGFRLEATGVVRPLTKQQKRTGFHVRAARERIQYRCLECQHVGWSRHVDAVRLYRAHQDSRNENTSRLLHSSRSDR